MNLVSGMRNIEALNPSTPMATKSKNDAAEELDYSAIWDAFSKKITQNYGVLLIQEPLGNRSVKEFVEDKVIHPVFFKGSFRLFSFPKVEDGTVVDFVMTSDHIPFADLKKEIFRVLGAMKVDEMSGIKITFKGRLLRDDRNFAVAFNWHGRGGEIFDLTIIPPVSPEKE
jgi:hypothetical protein